MPLFRLSRELTFPPPSLSMPDGLLAVGGDLSVNRLLLAYRSGIFPWYSEGDPILWWSPDPRMLLFPEEFHLSRRLERTIKQAVFDVRMDTVFDRVIAACAMAPRQKGNGTWITRQMRDAYCRLHREGYAHSVETWRDGKLVGGLYGVSVGACFIGESMFSLEPNTSKIAMAALVRQALHWKFPFIDCQLHTPHLASLGAREVPRSDYLLRLGRAIAHETHRGAWKFVGWTDIRKPD
ncbi:MAG: leucyl/phenylalanyl-tRNA--protein transferase [Candidatus Hydrogenedentes bacterium]|nr:leucyl/phenylalanyl-tRNA--protein transferase [Candidatus Hydrogenedentota bacterium]